MNFDKESKSEKKNFFFGGGGGGGGGGGAGGEGGEGFQPDKKKIHTKNNTIGIHLFFLLMLYNKFQVPSSSGSLTQTKGVTDR